MFIYKFLTYLGIPVRKVRLNLSKLGGLILLSVK